MIPGRPQPNEVQVLHKWNTLLEAATYLRSSIPLFAARLGVVRKLPAPSAIHPSLSRKTAMMNRGFPLQRERDPFNAGANLGFPAVALGLDSICSTHCVSLTKR